MVKQLEQGYVALIAVLIIGAASTAIALGLLMTGVDSQRSVDVSQRSAQARNIANACAEEALQVLHDNTSFTGNGNLTLGQGSCTYTVANTGGSNRSVTVSATVTSVVRRVQVHVTIGVSSISITSWQEVI
jgi:hypothetical protein